MKTISHFNFGRSLRLAQAKRAVSSKELAQALGVSKQQISRYRYSEDAKLSTVIKIANAFELDPIKFLENGLNHTDG